MAGHVRPRCYLDIVIGTEPAGRIVIELFDDQTPKTCENFRALCTASHGASLSYKSSIFHRVIEEFMIQGGDITLNNGHGGKSIYGDLFEDENLSWKPIDAPNLVCMANRGPGTNSSQFFITLEDCSHLNGKHTVFGHVVSGIPVLKKIEAERVNKEDKPLTDIIIANCGELEFKKAPAATTTSKKAITSSSKRDSRSSSRERSHRHHRSHRKTRSRSRSRSRSSPPDRMSVDRGRSLTPQPSTRKKDRHRSRSPSRSPIRHSKRKRSPKRAHYHRSYGFDDEEEARIRREEEEREGRRLRVIDLQHNEGGGGGGGGSGSGDGVVYKGRGRMSYREQKQPQHGRRGQGYGRLQ